jgi:ribulose 1,5-bisphosphate synthetase/thiazole synthase
MSNQGYGKGELPGADRGPPKQRDVRQNQIATLRDSKPRHNMPLHSERPMRVICIGAGASGLCFAYKLQRSFTNFSLTVYEKNAEVSGTW